MEDEKIIEYYFARDERALTETARKYSRMIKAIAYRILKNSPDSEECENDTYHVAWNKIPPARPPFLSAFLGRIARNLAFDRYDYNTAAKRNEELETGLEELENCIGSPDSVETEYERRQLAGQISDFLRSTGSVKRAVFLRRYWYCDSIADISARYGFSAAKVKSMLMRTRRELKKYLNNRGSAV